MPTFEEFLKNLILTGSTVLIGRIYNNYKTKSFTISTSTIKVTHTRLVELKNGLIFLSTSLHFFCTAIRPHSLKVSAPYRYYFFFLSLSLSMAAFMN